MPPTRGLAGQLSLSRTTVAEAYDQLQAEGYLEGKLGSGTYVASNLPGDGLRTSGQEARASDSPARSLRLSRWGARIAEGEYRSLLRPSGSQTWRFDLRPHGVAHDAFPWDAWHAAVERAVTRDHARLTLYPPSMGHPPLREAIAAHVAQYRSVKCSADNVVIVNGSLQGLNLLAQLLCDSGDRVIMEDPGYPSARLAFEAQNLDVQRMPVDADGMIVDHLARFPPARMVHVTPSHQEPTGATLSLGRRLALLEHAQREGAVILEDDYDSEFRYEGRPVESLQGLDQHGLVVYAGTFSKSVLAGLRIGFLVLPQQLVAPFASAKTLWDSGTPMLEQATLAEFMQAGDFERHIRRMRRLYRGRRDTLVTALVQTFGNRVTIGERHGGLNVLVTLDVRLSEPEVLRRAAAAGIGLRSAAAYYRTPPSKPTFLIGFSTLSEDSIRLGVMELGAALRVAPALSGLPTRSDFDGNR
ncbi:MAG: PLP-dependent aminotransferase family protein [Chloroflexota bacterium]